MKNRLVHGVGINDAEYKTHICKTVDGVTRAIWRCPFYKVWSGMLERAYSEKCHDKHPTYRDVTVNEPWHTFSVFRLWMENQTWMGNEIDKDILFPGNREYSEDKCVFVPASLNSFLADSRSNRGKYPLGVTWDSSSNKFKSTCRNPFIQKVENLGRFDDPNEAHNAWRKRKHELACRYADMQTDERIALALRKRFAHEGDFK